MEAKTKNVKNKRIDNEVRIAQYKAAKERLNKCLAKSDNTRINFLRDELNTLCKFEINYETLRKTLDIRSNTFDIYCVIALCKYFNLDIAYVLSDPSTPENEIIGNAYTSDRVKKLGDEKYFGKYYGYIYSPKKSNTSIDYFELEINKTKKGSNEIYAKLCVSYNAPDISGQNPTGQKIFTGTPVLIEPNNIYIVFHENSGAFCIFSFNYVKYNVSNMYFRRGAMITQGREAARHTMMQSFVMFDRPVDPENTDIIKGFLLLNDDVFHLPVREMTDLISKDSDTEKLYNNLKYLFEANKEDYYLVDELQILHSLKSFMSKTDAVRVLQLMKSRASDARRIYFPESNEYSEFSKLIKKTET